MCSGRDSNPRPFDPNLTLYQLSYPSALQERRKQTALQTASPKPVVRHLTQTSSPATHKGLVARQTSQPIYRQGGRKLRQSRATQPRCIDVPDLGDNFCRATHLVGIVTVLILSAMVGSWHPTGASLAEGRSGTLSCNPAQELETLLGSQSKASWADLRLCAMYEGRPQHWLITSRHWAPCTKVDLSTG